MSVSVSASASASESASASVSVIVELLLTVVVDRISGYKKPVLGALVWVWGPAIPAQITDKYPGFPARVATVDVTARPQRPLGVEILTSFGEGRLVKGRQWVSVEYGYDDEALYRRCLIQGNRSSLGGLRQGRGCGGGRQVRRNVTGEAHALEEGEVFQVCENSSGSVAA